MRSDLLKIFFVSFFIRLAFFLLYPYNLNLNGGDFLYYSKLANFLLKGEYFNNEVYVAPGFVFLLAFIYFLFGNSYYYFFIFQILFSSFIPIILYLILNLLTKNRKNAFWCGIASSFWFHFVIQVVDSSSLLFYSFIFLLSIFLFFYGIFCKKYFYIFSSGVFLGFAILIDPVATYIPIIFIFVIFLYYFIEKISIRKTLLFFSLFIFSILIVVLPWMYRNYVVNKVNNIKSSVSIVSKRELDVFKEDQRKLILYTFLNRADVVLSGLFNMYVIPNNLYLLTPNTDISYKDILLMKSNDYSNFNKFALFLKIFIAFLHIVLIILSFVSFVYIVLNIFYKNKRVFLFSMFVFFILLYITFGVIGVGSLRGDNFKGISQLGGFIFPVLPLLFALVFISFNYLSFYNRSKNEASYFNSKS